MKFTYSSGQRPLDGYTIKRGIGHGGFGEVYFALSDGGKEVALKVIRRNLDIELRGMSHCLNFKHPNLVQLFDIKKDAEGNHWVIMEYVGGESLNNILARHPNGLPVDLMKQWFRGLANAVSYLHDHGIVHRDLKPGNIFVENGAIKVGDYGLCKFISHSQHSPQTQSVGTVYYMAPEISGGNYNKQIDIYAAGVMLYEMLTGRLPFEGQSAAEILMKHLTSAPDLSKVPAEYRKIVEKALAKNPAHRHKSMAELARDVEQVGEEPILVPLYTPPAKRPLYDAKPIPVTEPMIPNVQPVVVPTRTRLQELSISLLMSAVLVALFSILWTALSRTNTLIEFGRYFFLALACCWAVLIPAKLWSKRVSESLTRRLGLMGLGLVVGLFALWLEGNDVSLIFANPLHASETAPVANNAVEVIQDTKLSERDPVWHGDSGVPLLASYLSYFGLAFFGLRWWHLADRRRTARFSLYSVFAAGILGLFLMILCPEKNALGVISLVMTAIVVQLVSPWQQPTESRPRKLRLPNA